MMLSQTMKDEDDFSSAKNTEQHNTMMEDHLLGGTGTFTLTTEELDRKI